MKNRIKVIAWLSLSIVFLAYVLVAFFTGTGKGINARDAFYELMGFLTVSTLVYTAAKVGSRDRRLWTFVAATGVFWMLGDIAYRGAEILGLAGGNRILSPADIFYLLSYASLICVVQTFARLAGMRNKGGFDWTKIYPPAAVIAAFFVSGILAFTMPNGIGSIGSTPPPSSILLIVNYMYPALDIVVLVSLMLIILTRNVSFKRAWHGLGIFGLALFTLADVNYSLAEPAGIYSPENIASRLIIAVWILGDILILMASVYRLTDVSEGLAVGSEVADDALLVSD